VKAHRSNGGVEKQLGHTLTYAVGRHIDAYYRQHYIKSNKTSRWDPGPGHVRNTKGLFGEGCYDRYIMSDLFKGNFVKTCAK